MTVAPVKIAMSSSIALRRSPKPGALTAHTLTTPRILFTTNVAKASLSISSAITSNALPDLETPSNTGNNSRMFDIFLSTSMMYGLSKSVVIFS